MVRKSLSLDGMLNSKSRPIATGIPQRGAEIQPARTLDIRRPPKKRLDEKRLTLALDGTTYRQLRMYAAASNQTHQEILEKALKNLLDEEGA